jgi:hypothetical protein
VIGLASLQGVYYSGNLSVFVTGWWEIVIGVVVAFFQLAAPEWAALVVAPVLRFAAGLIWIDRRERNQPVTTAR